MLTLFLQLPPEERQRLQTFAKLVGRPMSWVVRDACRLYMDAAEADPESLNPLRAGGPKLDLANAGKTQQGQRGRPADLATLEADLAILQEAGLIEKGYVLTAMPPESLKALKLALAALKKNPTTPANVR